MKELSLIIRQKMKEKRLTAKALSEISGIKMSTIHNLTTGRSKNPTLNILQPLTKALDCTLSELIEDNKPQEDESPNINLKITNNKLFSETLMKLSELLNDNINSYKLMEIYKIIKDVYKFSIVKGEGRVDIHFLEWQLNTLVTNYKKVPPS